jgi:nicotinamide-nucleotide amidase
MFTSEISDLAQRIGTHLRVNKQTVAVAEGSAGGLISAALLSIPGASAYFVGGSVVYTAVARNAYLADTVAIPTGMRGATEEFARYLAEATVARLDVTWALAEAGAAGPPNRYGDPAGHTWLAVAGPAPGTHQLLTGLDARVDNMVAFATGALTLLCTQLALRAT